DSRDGFRARGSRPCRVHGRRGHRRRRTAARGALRSETRTHQSVHVEDLVAARAAARKETKQKARVFVLVLAPSPNASPILVYSAPAVPVVRNGAQTSNANRVESNHFEPRFSLVRALFLRLSSPATHARAAMLRKAVFQRVFDHDEAAHPRSDGRRP